MPLSLEEAKKELEAFADDGAYLDQIIAYMHMRALEDQTAAIREGTLANERVHERVLNTVSHAQGRA